MGSIGLGNLTSIQLDGAVAAKTSTSTNETSSSIPTRVLPHFPPDGKVGLEWVVGPSQPNIAASSHKQVCAVTGQVDSTEHHTTHLRVVGTGTYLLKGVPVGVCGHC